MKRITLLALAIGILIGTVCMANAQVSLTIDGNTISSGSVVIITGATPPIPPQPCAYIYSAWGACQPNGTQTRSVISIAPPGCAGTPTLSQSCPYVPPVPVQGQLLAWNVNHTVLQFAPNETKTLIARVAKNLAGKNAKQFQIAFVTMGLTITDGSFKIPFKPDGSSYTTFNGKNEITGFKASNEGGITLNVGYNNIILNSDIYPGDFILTLTADAQGGWGYLSTSIYY